METRMNGKRYNTGTARKVGEWDNEAVDEAYHVIETLYRKKNGEFFLHCRGGALVPYLDSAKAPFEGVIKLLTEELAKNWVKKHLTEGDYDRIFSKQGDDVETESISAAIPIRLKAEMDNVRKSTGETISEFVSRAVKMLIESAKGNPEK